MLISFIKKSDSKWSVYISNGKHKNIGQFGFSGTPEFDSIKGLEGYTLSRRDDLETLGYTLLYLRDSSLMLDSRQKIQVE